jgi:hypothetical protein
VSLLNLTGKPARLEEPRRLALSPPRGSRELAAARVIGGGSPKTEATPRREASAVYGVWPRESEHQPRLVGYPVRV